MLSNITITIVLYYNSNFLWVKWNIRRKLKTTTSYLFIMKLFSIYLFCIALLTYHGLSMANNIKKDLLNQSNSINQAVTSYSQYLQTLN